MHWLARMAGIGLWWIGKWGILVLIFESTWEFFYSLGRGLSVDQAMVWGLFAFGAGGLALLAAAYLLDYLAGLLPEVIARRKVAKFFKDMALHDKHQATTLSTVVYFWNGGQWGQGTMGEIQDDFKLHHLKAAIAQRILTGHGPGGSVTESTLCRPDDLATFFGGWKWIWVKDELWKGATYEGDSE